MIFKVRFQFSKVLPEFQKLEKKSREIVDTTSPTTRCFIIRYCDDIIHSFLFYLCMFIRHINDDVISLFVGCDITSLADLTPVSVFQNHQLGYES